MLKFLNNKIFKNLNLIGSLALPSKFKISKKTNLVFSPKIIFLPEEQFNENISANEYIEHAVVHGNLYGTPRSQIDNYLAEDYKVLLEIDWQGAVSVLEQYPKATSIFISPPSIEELRTRLENRGLDSQEVIEKRVQGAKLEMEKAAQFRHQITNISLDIATKNLLNIIFRENHG